MDIFRQNRHSQQDMLITYLVENGDFAEIYPLIPTMHYLKINRSSITLLVKFLIFKFILIYNNVKTLGILGNIYNKVKNIPI